jgi:hypothetical protein
MRKVRRRSYQQSRAVCEASAGFVDEVSFACYHLEIWKSEFPPSVQTLLRHKEYRFELPVFCPVRGLADLAQRLCDLM